MVINLQDILIALGGQAAFLGAVAWLAKSLLSHRLAREAEEFKIKLKAETDIEIERLKNSLQIVAAEHQVRFERLHEKRAEIIAQLYALLIDARNSAEFIFGDVSDPAWAKETHDKVFELYRFTELNRIYLQPAVCELLDNFAGKLTSSVAKVRVSFRNPAPSEEQVKMQIMVVREVCEALDSDLPAMREELEKEFRAMLGVESPASISPRGSQPPL